MTLTLAAVQYACGPELEANLDTAERLVRAAAAQGARLVLLPELFASRFFYNFDWDPAHFARAETLAESPALARMRALARELGVVLPANIFERAGQAHFNTTVMIDADGRDLGIYRKMHMPLGPPSCFEKYYAAPGDTGFRVFETAVGRLGCGICWDQWFPETARILALKGAELLLFPTAIGTDCHDHWQAVMCGHAAANLMPLAAANRVGREAGAPHATAFWGRSFIADHTGALRAKAGGAEEVIVATVDLAEARRARADWGVFRDRRPEAYGALLTLDGETPASS